MEETRSYDSLLNTAFRVSRMFCTIRIVVGVKPVLFTFRGGLIRSVWNHMQVERCYVQGDQLRPIH